MAANELMETPEKRTETILIAGGTGMIGTYLVKKWRKEGHRVKVLDRKLSQPSKGLYFWDAMRGEIDPAAGEDVTVIVNLAGAGIGDKKWTEKRKQELVDSRVKTTEFLWKTFHDSPTLTHYISASGINCYGYDDEERLHIETDEFGTDTLSKIVVRWEHAADLFKERCMVTKVRTATVLAKNDGALKTIAKPIKWGVGSPLGSGKQFMPWIHIQDLAQLYTHVLEHKLEGAYNANAGNISNKELTREIAHALHKPLWLPRIPAGILKLVLGEMSDLVLMSMKADNALIRSTGFEFAFTSIKGALNDIYGKKSEPKA